MSKSLPPPAPRRPAVVPAADTATADAFVNGSASALKALEVPEQPSSLSAPSALDAPGASSAPSAPVTRRKLVARSDGRQVRRLVAYFEPTIARRLERWCVDNEHDVSGAIVEAVRRMLEVSGH